MEIAPLPPDPSETDIAGVHRVLVAAAAVERPGDPPPLVEDVATRLRYAVAQQRTPRWVARTGEGITGLATLRLPDADNTHLGQLAVTVHPQARRRGTGTALLRPATAALVGEGRRLLLGEADEDTAGEPFCRSLGMRLVQRDRMALLRLADVDWADVERLAAAPHPGYRLVRWRRHCPDELLETLAVAKTAMNDAPFDDAELEDQTYTAAGIRADEDALLRRYDENPLVVAVHEASGAIAGFTEVHVTRQAHRSYQGDTAVVAEHRGHGLGLWLKGDMLTWLRAERPDVAELLTGNSATNTHMLAVNDRLGYRTWNTILGFQAGAADVLSRIG